MPHPTLQSLGPWPIKRSQSVPDTSNSLFTPDNSPPSLARFLAREDGEPISSRYPTHNSSAAPTLQERWSQYSISQPARDVESNEKTRTHQRRRSTTHRNPSSGTILIRALFLLSFLVTGLGPAVLLYYVKKNGLIRVTFPEKTSHKGTLYVLFYLWTTSVGTLIVFSFLYANDFTRKRVRSTKMVVLSLPILFAVGALLAILWIGTTSSVKFDDGTKF